MTSTVKKRDKRYYLLT